jgi:hypothetical protein
MFEQRDAIVRLLSDDDPHTVNLVKEQLLDRGAEAIEGLTELLNCDSEIVAKHVREILAEIDSRAASSELGAMCSDFSQSGDLEKANWLLARVITPGVHIPTYERQLDHWGDRVATITANVVSPRERIRLMGEFLGQGLNLRGNTIDYYAAENSLLPSVIETRLGIPISLSLIYMLVGKRAGLDVEGVNFPGHFIVRHERIMFDPFERGRIMSMSDCESILARQKMSPRPVHFQRATSLTIFTRILANLLYIYQTDGEEKLSTQISDWIRRLQRLKG